MIHFLPMIDFVPVWLTHPTSTRPGSPGKVAIMALRYEAGVPLFVAGDFSLLPPDSHDSSPAASGGRLCHLELPRAAGSVKCSRGER